LKRRIRLDVGQPLMLFRSELLRDDVPAVPLEVSNERLPAGFDACHFVTFW
jgi:hypothetical protein